jgi:hypothetical protein
VCGEDSKEAHVASYAGSEGKWGRENGLVRRAMERRGASWAMATSLRPPGALGGAGPGRAAQQNVGSSAWRESMEGPTWKRKEARRPRLVVMVRPGKKGNGPGPRNSSLFYLFNFFQKA